MSPRAKIALFAAELLALVALRVVFMIRRNAKKVPVGSRVRELKGGQPVYNYPDVVGGKEPELPKFEWRPKFTRNKSERPNSAPSR